MSKKLFVGALLGSAVTGAAWLSLSTKKKAAIKKQFNERTNAAMTTATDYVLDALDIVDAKMADVQANEKFNSFADSAKNIKKAAQAKASKFADHLTNDDFDKQTADIRASLAAAKHPDDNDDAVVDDDIVIDNTTDSNQSTNPKKDQ